MRILKIPGISRPSGGWATKWSSLQFQLLFYFASALLISWTFFSLSSWGFQVWMARENRIIWDQQRDSAQKRVRLIGRSLAGMADEEAREYLQDYVKEFRAAIMLIDSQGEMVFSDSFTMTLLDYDLPRGVSLPSVYIPVDLSEGSGLLIYQQLLSSDKFFIEENQIFLAPLAIGLFIVLFFLFSRNIIKAIRNISSQVECISRGDFSARVKMARKDELRLLAENINLMGDSIESMLFEVKRVERQKRELISGISHDLKTPLTLLIGYLSLLKNREVSDPEDQNRFISLCYNQAHRLKVWVEDLFTYAKFTDQTIVRDRVEFSFRTLVDQVLEEHHDQLKNQGIDLEVSFLGEDRVIPGDPSLIGRVLNNLLENLSRYCDGEKTAVLELDSRSDRIVFTLGNTAQGLEIEDPEWLFERMVRGDQARSDGEGSGLGLAICREIVRLHGGTIRLDLNNGWFSVTLELF